MASYTSWYSAPNSDVVVLVLLVEDVLVLDVEDELVLDVLVEEEEGEDVDVLLVLVDVLLVEEVDVEDVDVEEVEDVLVDVVVTHASVTTTLPLDLSLDAAAHPTGDGAGIGAAYKDTLI